MTGSTFALPEWLASHAEEVRGWSAVRGPNPRCQVGVCDRTVHSLGLCSRHYDRFRRVSASAGMSLAAWIPSHSREVTAAAATGSSGSSCWVGECERDANRNGLCKAHYKLARSRFRPRSAAVVLSSDAVPTISTTAEVN